MLDDACSIESHASTTWSRRRSDSPDPPRHLSPSQMPRSKETVRGNYAKLQELEDQIFDQHLQEINAHLDDLKERMQGQPADRESQTISMQLSGTMLQGNNKRMEQMQNQLDNIADTLSNLARPQGLGKNGSLLPDEERETIWQRERETKKQREQDDVVIGPSGRRLRSGKTLPSPEFLDSDSETDSTQPPGMYPLVARSSGRSRYVPWAFCDMIGLVGRLPDLTEGANKLITSLVENTAGVSLALGDIKALLMNIVGKHVTEEILQNATIKTLLSDNSLDGLHFNLYRNEVWRGLRK